MAQVSMSNKHYYTLAEMALAGNMTLSKEEEEYINIITKYLVPVMFSLVILIGSIGNILVIYVVRSTVIVSDSFEDIYLINLIKLVVWLSLFGLAWCIESGGPFCLVKRNIEWNERKLSYFPSSLVFNKLKSFCWKATFNPKIWRKEPLKVNSV